MEQWEVIAVDKNSIMRFKNEGKEIAGVRWLLKGAAQANGPQDPVSRLQLARSVCQQRTAC